MDIRNILSRVDHTLLAVDATGEQIDKLCDEAAQYGTASVCVAPAWIERAAARLEGKVAVCTVVGFPTGYMTPEAKAAETADAVRLGADEIDMVINIGRAKQGDYDYIAREIALVRNACPGKVLKVIIETCLLTDEEKLELCAVVRESGADYIKTSTGFSKHGATPHDVELLVRGVEGMIKVKAAGGIRSLEDAQMYLDLGADRLGTSAVVRCVKETEESAGGARAVVRCVKEGEAPDRQIAEPVETESPVDGADIIHKWVKRIIVAMSAILAVIALVHLVSDKMWETATAGYDIDTLGEVSIEDYYGSESAIVLPDVYYDKPVTRVGECAFFGDDDIVSVTVPESITVIEDEAFSICDNLETVVLHSGVEMLGEGAFSHCKSLKSINLPENLEIINQNAFEWCLSLTSIEIPARVQYIREGTFAVCESLETVTFAPEASVIWIEQRAFIYCESLAEIDIPQSVRDIGDYAFIGCKSLARVTLHGAPDIGDYAFSGCESLTEITLPEGEMRIGDYAFSGCPATIYAPHEPEWYGLVPGDYDGEWVIIGA